MRMLRLLAAAPLAACAATSPGTPDWVRVSQLADLELEQLTRITVTTTSRREENLSETPASVFVITGEDIRRSGATTLTDALRLAPNLQVRQGDSNQVVISARGGLTSTANKMLVLVDGRTIYTPLFSGVFWDAQDLMLADIERIEVVSGPGSTLWGTNAVNGLISITTKAASKTRGVLVTLGAGGYERGVAARVGASAAGIDYRVYVKGWDHDERELASGASALDAANRKQAGFRADWGGPGASGTLQGDLYAANVDTIPGYRDLSGGNVLGRWRSRAGDSDVSVQAYYDRTKRDHEHNFRETRDTVDVEAQQAFPRRGGHEVIWGVGYRTSRDRTADNPAIAFVPTSRTLGIASLFAQDEIALAPRLEATVGVRAERNTFTGLEWLPNLRLAWTPSPDHVLWTSLTRTVRTPSRIDRDAQVPGQPPFLLVANESFESEKADVAEIGYRARLAPRTNVSLTAFHHRFRGLRTAELQGSTIVFANGADGRLSGIEGWVESVVTPSWRLTAGFTAMRDTVTILPGHANLADPPYGNNPRRTAQLRSLWNAAPGIELDVAWRYSGALTDPVVPSHAVVDARIGWRVHPSVELSLVARNVLDRDVVEFATPAQRAVLGRTIFLKLTWTP